MRRIFNHQLATPEAELAIEQAFDAARGKRAALLCFEADAGACHRAVVADRLLERGDFSVANL